MRAVRRVALQDVAMVEREIVEPSEIRAGTLFVGLENIETGGRFINVRPVDSGELASSKFSFTRRHVLYGKLRPYLAKIARPDFEGICSTDILPVLPGPELDRGYLSWLLLTPEMVSLAASRATGANLPRLSPDALGEIRIPLLSLDEQRRIAAILDKADELRAKRRDALARLDTLTQSIFLDMFGDPTTNPKNYPVALMGDVCDVRDGTHDSPKYVSDSGYPLVTSKNVTGGAIDLTEVNYISEADYIQINKRSKVDKGDIILPMIGTIGSPVLVDHDPNYAIKNVALIKFIEGSPAAVYLHHLLSGRYFDYIVSRKNRGGTQKFVSLGDLRAFPLPLPPRQEQDEFLRRMEEIRRIRSLNSVAASRLDDVFTSLQSHAFRGEL